MSWKTFKQGVSKKWKPFKYARLDNLRGLKTKTLRWTLDEDKDLTLSICSFLHFVKVKDRVVVKVRFRRYEKAPTRLYITNKDPLQNPELVGLINQLEPARQQWMKTKRATDQVVYINLIERINTVCQQYTGK